MTLLVVPILLLGAGAPMSPAEFRDLEPVPFETGYVVPEPWASLAECESNQTWDIVSPPHYGGLQFTVQSWEGVGGEGLPSDASPREQVERAEALWELQGWGAWPTCSRRLGLVGAP